MFMKVYYTYTCRGGEKGLKHTKKHPEMGKN
jgi:hypothetical protein